MLDLAAAFATFPRLETPRLILRAITTEDTQAVFSLRSDARVMRYFGSLPMSSVAQAAQLVSDAATGFQEQTNIRWAITRRETPRMIGSCMCWQIARAHHRAEIGYELAPEFWGQGLVVEALGAMLKFGFEVMNLHSVEAQIDPANNGSRRVLEKCGFVQEGYFHENFYLNEQFTDTAVFSLIQSTWLKQYNARSSA